MGIMEYCGGISDKQKPTGIALPRKCKSGSMTAIRRSGQEALRESATHCTTIMVRREYEGNFTGGSLLSRETRVVAGLLADKHNRDQILGLVLAKNLFQNRSKATTHKYCQLILTRLGNLTEEQVRFVASGGEELRRLTLFVAVLKTYPLIASFMENIVAERVRCFETHLNRSDWMQFLEHRAKVDASIKEWSDKSQRKMGQVVIRMLAEAGFLDNTRQMTILFPTIPPELAQSLKAGGDGRLLTCLRLGR